MVLVALQRHVLFAEKILMINEQNAFESIVVSKDEELLRLLSMVWMDAKDWRIFEFKKLIEGQCVSLDALNLAVLNPKSSPKVLDILKKPFWWRDYRQKLQTARAQNVRWIPFFDPEYPVGLLDLDENSGTAPLGVWMQGTLESSAALLSVVGSRHPTQGILLWMKAELQPNAQTPWTIVSGGAVGVDQWAHEICLAKEMATVVVLPCGISNPYPKQWEQSRNRVLDSGGCFISEYEGGMPIMKFHFQARNRLIAALSPVTVVLQAAQKSGTWMTANWAERLSRKIAVVPGPAWDRRFDGSFDLIRANNLIVTSRKDVAELVPMFFKGNRTDD